MCKDLNSGVVNNGALQKRQKPVHPFSPITILFCSHWLRKRLCLYRSLSLVLRSLSNPSSPTSSRRKWGHTEKTKSKAINNTPLPQWVHSENKIFSGHHLCTEIKFFRQMKTSVLCSQSILDFLCICCCIRQHNLKLQRSYLGIDMNRNKSNIKSKFYFLTFLIPIPGLIMTDSSVHNKKLSCVFINNLWKQPFHWLHLKYIQYI